MVHSELLEDAQTASPQSSEHGARYRRAPTRPLADRADTETAGTQAVEGEAAYSPASRPPPIQAGSTLRLTSIMYNMYTGSPWQRTGEASWLVLKAWLAARLLGRVPGSARLGAARWPHTQIMGSFARRAACLGR